MIRSRSLSPSNRSPISRGLIDARSAHCSATFARFPDLLIMKDLKSTRINTSRISKIPRISFTRNDFNPCRINTSETKDLKSFIINTSKTKDLKSFRINTSKKQGRGVFLIFLDLFWPPFFARHRRVSNRRTRTPRRANQSRRRDARAQLPMLE
jgi:hypothetical protein